MLTLRIDSAVSSGNQGEITYFIYFPWPPLEAGLYISKFCSLFKSSRTLLFLSDPLLIIRRFPKEITQNQALVSTVFNVY
jgi:hypothetical protein